MSKIMILGTFHMKNRNEDFIYGEHQIIKKDIEKLIESLEEFKPTKIAVEYNSQKSGKLNDEYSRYVRGDFRLSEDEIHQIAFRLGKVMGLEKIHCSDWNEKVSNTLSMGDVFDQIKESNKAYLVDDLFHDGEEMVKKIETLNNKYSLIEALKYINSEEGISESSWLNNRLINFNINDEFIGNKWLHGWYIRNLNIASNILNITEKEDRVLVIFGSSHTKLLKEMIGQHPEIKLENPLNYL